MGARIRFGGTPNFGSPYVGAGDSAREPQDGGQQSKLQGKRVTVRMVLKEGAATSHARSGWEGGHLIESFSTQRELNLLRQNALYLIYAKPGPFYPAISGCFHIAYTGGARN